MVGNEAKSLQAGDNEITCWHRDELHKFAAVRVSSGCSARNLMDARLSIAPSAGMPEGASFRGLLWR